MYLACIQYTPFYFRPVRRFFCLLVAFDFLFSGLLWLITVIILGGSIEEHLKEQVFSYKISTSMFDIVVSLLSINSP